MDIEMLHKQDERYLPCLLRQECLKRGLYFVAHCGIRGLFYNGDSIGLTTQADWNDSVQKERMINHTRYHIITESQFMAQHNLTYIIRSQEFANNAFLQSLVEAKLCNGIGIYSSNQFGVVGYFFNAEHNNKEAVQLFINKIDCFQSIVHRISLQLEKEGYWNKVMISRNCKNLLTGSDRSLVFSNKKLLPLGSAEAFLGLNKHELTHRETQILHLLQTGNTTKDLAKIFNNGVRTIETHLGALRKKAGVKSTKDLIIKTEMFEQIYQQ
jgi:DNA-binding CsgD family transcriptional regulator